MAGAPSETSPVTEAPSILDRAVDAARHATHASHQARLLTSLASDVREDGIHAVKRVVKRVQRGVETLEDYKEELSHCIKHQPLKAVGVAAGGGLLLGVAIGWMCRRLGPRHA